MARKSRCTQGSIDYVRGRLLSDRSRLTVQAMRESLEDALDPDMHLYVTAAWCTPGEGSPNANYAVDIYAPDQLDGVDYLSKIVDVEGEDVLQVGTRALNALSEWLNAPALSQEKVGV